MTRPDHERFMRRCLELAAEARNQGNTPVGSVVVLDGAIIGQGIETLPTGPSITGHAETLACQAAILTSRPIEGRRRRPVATGRPGAPRPGRGPSAGESRSDGGRPSQAWRRADDATTVATGPVPEGLRSFVRMNDRRKTPPRSTQRCSLFWFENVGKLTQQPVPSPRSTAARGYFSFPSERGAPRAGAARRGSELSGRSPTG